MANYVKHKLLKRMKFDFNVSSFSKTNVFVKYDSFNGEVIKKSANGKGRLLCMTKISNSLYYSLKNYGVAFIKESIDIHDESYEKTVC